MKKRIIVTENQLKEYIERKKAKKTFNIILEKMNENSKFLNKKIPLSEANQTIIERFKMRNQLTPHVQKLLKENNIIDNNGQII